MLARAQGVDAELRVRQTRCKRFMPATGHDGFHKIRKAFCVLSRLFGYAAKKSSDFLCFNDANCFPINTEQIIGFALLRSMSPGRDLMLCANTLLTIGVVPPAK